MHPKKHGLQYENSHGCKGLWEKRGWASHIKTSKVTHQRRQEPNFKSSIVLYMLNGYEMHDYTIVRHYIFKKYEVDL